MTADKVAQIKKGSTTRTEVEALLGPPANVSILPDGKRMLMYTYVSNKMDAHANATAYIPYVGLFAGGGKGENQNHSQTLQIMVNGSNIVEDYEFHDSTTNTVTQTGGLLGMSSSATSSTSGTAVTAADNDKK